MSIYISCGWYGENLLQAEVFSRSVTLAVMLDCKPSSWAFEFGEA